MKKIKLSILIPCFNEFKYISSCLDSIIANDFNHNNYEILIIDGGSTDGTLKILNKFCSEYNFIKVIDNPKKTKSSALNIGIKESIGEVIMRIDAHAVYNKNYISTLVSSLYSEGVDNTGGVRDTYISVNGGTMEITISLMISNPLIVGNAFYRTGNLSKNKIVHTVFGGCYKKEIFYKIGLFNENLIRAQDREFNARIINSGGKILLIPTVRCTYFSRTKFLEYLKWNWDGAKWLGYTSKFTNIKILLFRNYIPVMFTLYVIFLKIIFFQKENIGLSFIMTLVLATPLIIYFLIMFIEGINKSIKYKRSLLILFFPLLAFITHISYGIGLIYGRVKYFL